MLFLWGMWVMAFFLLEAIGLFGGDEDSFPTLTEVITAYLPGFLIYMGIGWLFWHFIASYHDNDKL